MRAALLDRVFLDAAGSAPMTPRTREALLAALDDGWADPERLHAESRRARSLLDGARASIATVLGSTPEHTHLVPTFGLAFDRVLAGIAGARRSDGRIVVSAIERKPLLRVAGRVAGEVVSVPVDPVGRVVDRDFAAAVAGKAVGLACLQHANQEIGTLQDVDAAYAHANKAGVPLVVDATSSVGHVEAPSQWDAIVADAPDWGGPRGIAVAGFRPGTRHVPVAPTVTEKVGVPEALAAAVALEEREERRAEIAPRLAALTSRVRETVGGWSRARVFGDPAVALPHIVTAAFEGVDGEVLASALDRKGFAVGTGSACTVEGSPESHVLAAVGAATTGNLRVGLHPGVSEDDVARFLVALREVLDDVARP